MCGEQPPPAPLPPGPGGSPPRVRGTVLLQKSNWIKGRITPACAGNSFHPGIRFLCGGDHPRVCGEQHRYLHMHSAGFGSPPRVRGTAFFANRSKYASRITPACAGNRPSMAPSENTVRDHPRVCGEQKMNIHIGGMQLGSPPRVRGTENPQKVVSPEIGITPACAGNSAKYLK